MGNLEPIAATPEALWLGSGLHFALEDRYGWDRFSGLGRAFDGYYGATSSSRPENAAELRTLAHGMLRHYESWLAHRSDFDTLWVDGVPQVEVGWRVPIHGIDPTVAVLGGTFDRLVTDNHGRVFIADYKSCAQFNTSKLDLDAQTSVYLWAYREMFGEPAEGMVYLQLKKAVPEPPRRLKSGALSVDKSQNTTWDLYREALGDDTDPARLAFLAWLRDQEDDSGDRFIRRDLVRRNEAQLDAVGPWLEYQARQIISLQADPITSPALYANFTYDCGMCPFHAACVAMDDGSDWQGLISGLYAQRERTNTPWRKHLPDPCELPNIMPASKAPTPCPSPSRPPAAVSLELPPQWWE
jgi:hypothetical protein